MYFEYVKFATSQNTLVLISVGPAVGGEGLGARGEGRGDRLALTPPPTMDFFASKVIHPISHQVGSVCLRQAYNNINRGDIYRITLTRDDSVVNDT